jgi:hypothetical protein
MWRVCEDSCVWCGADARVICTLTELKRGDAYNGLKWEGMPQTDEIKQGDVVGLLLDLGQRTLSVYLNGARRVMVAPGMKDLDGDVVSSLVGPLRWAVDLQSGDSVRIERRPAPGPVPSTEGVAAAVAWDEASHEHNEPGDY